MTEGEAVKDKITGIVKAAEVGIFPVDPLPLQADRAKMKRTIIIGVKDL
jgi:hypothetical protein